MPRGPFSVARSPGRSSARRSAARASSRRCRHSTPSARTNSSTSTRSTTTGCTRPSRRSTSCSPCYRGSSARAGDSGSSPRSGTVRSHSRSTASPRSATSSRSSSHTRTPSATSRIRTPSCTRLRRSAPSRPTRPTSGIHPSTSARRRRRTSTRSRSAGEASTARSGCSRRSQTHSSTSRRSCSMSSRTKSPKARAAELRQRLNEASSAYYVEDEPIMSDAEFDRLYDELLALEEAHPALVTPDSPTQRVGTTPSDRFRKVEHLAPMGSLDKVTSDETLGKFADDVRKRLGTDEEVAYLVEPKIDGLAVSLLYENGIGQAEGLELQSQSEILRWLRAHGFRTNPYAERLEAIDEVGEAARRWETRRAELDYEIDGIVIKVDALDQQRRLGSLHGRPRWARAFKWAPMTAQTKLEKIHIRVGRTGALNPWAQLAPVEVSGVTVTSATLHNEEDINRKNIREGDTVIVQRAGDVIPQVVGPVLPHAKGTKPFRMPAKCPLCGADVVRPAGEVMHRCPNRACPSRGLETLIHWVQAAMDIEGVGEQFVRRFWNEGLLRSMPDLYRLTAEQLAEHEGYAEISARNAVESIARSKEQPFRRVLLGLNIPHVGWVTAQNLVRHFGSIDALTAASQ